MMKLARQPAGRQALFSTLNRHVEGRRTGRPSNQVHVDIAEGGNGLANAVD